MARRFTRPRGRLGAQRRESLWLFGGFADTAIGAASTAVLLAQLNAAALALRPFTIVRTRGFIHGASDQISASETWGGAYGMSVVSDQAAAIGITAVPTPVADQGSDLWYVYEMMVGRLVADSTAGFKTEVGAELRFDSKAMRRVEEGQTIVVVAETPALSSSWQIKDSFRFLVKLH